MSQPDPELLSLLSDLGEVESEIARLQAQRDRLREQLSIVVASRYGNRAVVPGYGTLAIRAPGVARVWDSGALNELVRSLREQGYGDLADEIEGCRRERANAGGLAITREKQAR